MTPVACYRLPHFSCFISTGPDKKAVTLKEILISFPENVRRWKELFAVQEPRAFKGNLNRVSMEGAPRANSKTDAQDLAEEHRLGMGLGSPCLEEESQRSLTYERLKNYLIQS